MNEFIEKLIERLEEKKSNLLHDEKAIQALGKDKLACFCLAKVEGVCDAIKIVDQLAEEYKICYKSCTECEAYDKEKHHCPKFCYIIAETVKEIEENQNVWIPTSERLPEKNAIVLTCDKDGWISVKVNMPYTGVKNDFECGYYVAWMPLPEPFKPISE